MHDASINAAVEAVAKYGTKQAAADRLGIPVSTLKSQLKSAALKGLVPFSPAPMPGFEIAQVASKQGDAWIKQRPEHGEKFAVPQGHVVKGVSALVDPDGREIAKWVKTKEGVDSGKLFEDLEARFATFAPAAEPVPRPAAVSKRLAFFPWADPHFGMMSWGRETGVAWDLKIAIDVTRQTFDALVAATPATKKAMLLVGGDTLHADSNDNRTPNSGNPLDVDGRHPKVFMAACEALVENIGVMLAKFEQVDVIVIPGNHDATSWAPLAFFLHAWFRNEPRVEVDLSPAAFRFRQFGKVMLAATHGHQAKVRDLPQIMAAREASMWGSTKFRYAHGFHVHHQSQGISEGGGCIWETHQIVAPQDAWHFGQGYLAGRSMQSILYDAEQGEVGRFRVALV